MTTEDTAADVLEGELRQVTETARRAYFARCGRIGYSFCPECFQRVESPHKRPEVSFDAADRAMMLHLTTCQPFISRLAREDH